MCPTSYSLQATDASSFIMPLCGRIISALKSAHLSRTGFYNGRTESRIKFNIPYGTGDWCCYLGQKVKLKVMRSLAVTYGMSLTNPLVNFHFHIQANQIKWNTHL